MKKFVENNAVAIWYIAYAIIWGLLMFVLYTGICNDDKLYKDFDNQAKILLNDGGGLFYAKGDREVWLYPLEKIQIAFDKAETAVDRQGYYEIDCYLEPNKYGIGYVKVWTDGIKPEK